MKIKYRSGDCVKSVQPIYENGVSEPIPKGSTGRIIRMACWRQHTHVYFEKYRITVCCDKGSIKSMDQSLENL